MSGRPKLPKGRMTADAMRSQSLAGLNEKLAALQYYKQQNEEALRRALSMEKMVKEQARFTSQDVLKKERSQWLSRITNEEKTKPLQIPAHFVQEVHRTQHEQAQRAAVSAAVRADGLHSLHKKMTARQRQRARQIEFHRLQGGGKGAESPLAKQLRKSDAGDERKLRQIEAIESQLLAQAASEPNLTGVDASFASMSGSPPAKPALRFRKKRTESSLTEPSQTYFTLQGSRSGPSIGLSSTTGGSGGVRMAAQKGGSAPRLVHSRPTTPIQRCRPGSGRGGGGGGGEVSLAPSGYATEPEGSFPDISGASEQAIRNQRQERLQREAERKQELDESARRTDAVVSGYLKQRRSMGRAKEKNRKKRLDADRRFIEYSGSVRRYVEQHNTLPPDEWFHKMRRGSRKGRGSISDTGSMPPDAADVLEPETAPPAPLPVVAAEPQRRGSVENIREINEEMRAARVAEGVSEAAPANKTPARAPAAKKAPSTPSSKRATVQPNAAVATRAEYTSPKIHQGSDGIYLDARPHTAGTSSSRGSSSSRPRRAKAEAPSLLFDPDVEYRLAQLDEQFQGLLASE